MCGVNCVKPGLRFRRILLICCLVFSVFWFPPAAVRADIGWGESPLVYVDTQGLEPGMLTGRILAGGTPIQGAAITLEPANLATTSEADGTFTLAGVPAGTGYQLQVIAAGYEVAIVSGLGVAGGSQDLGDIVLSPLTGTFVLRSTVPEINPAVSEVEQGGVAYRYYIVRNQADGTPVGGVSVVVREAGCGTPVDQTEAGALPGVAGKVAGVSDVGSGIVRLRIPADEVGSGLPGASEQFEAVVSGTVGPTFWVSVRARSYEHDWAQESRGGLHGKVNLIAGGRLGGEVGHRVEVVRAYDGSSETEELAREMAGRVEFGVEAGLPIGGKANVAGVTAGAYASAGAGGYAELYRAFGYEFDPYSTDASSAALRLYCMYAELGDFVPVMGPLLMLVRTTIEPILVDDVYRWSEAGFQFGPYVEVEGILGAKVGKEFAVGAYGNLDVEGAIGASTRYHVLEGRRESQIGVGATIEAAAGIGIGFRPYKGTGRPAGVETVMNNLGVLLNPSASASLTVEQSAMDVVYDGASRPSEVRLVMLIGGGLNVPGFNLIDYLGTGAQQGEELAIAELDLIQPIASSADWERTKGISGKLRLLYDRLGPVGMNAIFGDEMARALFPQDP